MSKALDNAVAAALEATLEKARSLQQEAQHAMDRVRGEVARAVSAGGDGQLAATSPVELRLGKLFVDMTVSPDQLVMIPKGVKLMRFYFDEVPHG